MHNMSTDEEIEFLLQRIAELEAKVSELEKKIRYRKKKRIRRTNEQIQKKFNVRFKFIDSARYATRSMEVWSV